MYGKTSIILYHRGTYFQSFCGYLSNLKNIYPQNLEIFDSLLILEGLSTKFLFKPNSLQSLKFYTLENKSPYGMLLQVATRN